MTVERFSVKNWRNIGLLGLIMKDLYRIIITVGWNLKYCAATLIKLFIAIAMSNKYRHHVCPLVANKSCLKDFSLSSVFFSRYSRDMIVIQINHSCTHAIYFVVHDHRNIYTISKLQVVNYTLTILSRDITRVNILIWLHWFVILQ